MIQNYLNKLYIGMITLLLAIIGFFLAATYNKITETNAMVYGLKIELASIREHQSQFMTYQATANLIDKKITQYHKDKFPE